MQASYFAVCQHIVHRASSRAQPHSMVEPGVGGKSFAAQNTKTTINHRCAFVEGKIGCERLVDKSLLIVGQTDGNGFGFNLCLVRFFMYEIGVRQC